MQVVSSEVCQQVYDPELRGVLQEHGAVQWLASNLQPPSEGAEVFDLIIHLKPYSMCLLRRCRRLVVVLWRH